MNLESTIYDAYSETLPVARAVAEQAALQLGLIRRGLEEQVFSLSASTTANTHELLKIATRLTKRASSKRQISRTELERTARDILASVSAMKSSRATESLALGAIVSGALDRNTLTSRCAVGGDVPDTNVFPPVETLMLKVVFGELLRNAAAAALGVPRRFRLQLTYGRRELGGAAFETVRLVNPILDPVSATDRDKLYRRPLHSIADDRIHVGAYLVGALLRSLGGDAYIDSGASDSDFATVVEIPLTAVAEG